MSWQNIEVKDQIVKNLDNLNVSHKEDRDCSVIQVTSESKYNFDTIMNIFIWKTFPNISIKLINKVPTERRLELLEFLNMLNRDTMYTAYLEKENLETEVLKLSLTLNNVNHLPSYTRTSLEFINKLERAMDLLIAGNDPHAVYLVCEFDD